MSKIKSNWQYIILCEDKLMQCYVRYFLLCQGVERKKIRCVALPTMGCGSQYVLKKSKEELISMHSKNFINQALFICIDADTKSVADRVKEIEMHCADETRKHDDAVVYFIPKRNIETWVKFYSSGENLSALDEVTDYGHFLRGRESCCRSSAENMSKEFMSDAIHYGMTSIANAFNEHKRLVGLQKTV